MASSSRGTQRSKRGHSPLSQRLERSLAAYAIAGAGVVALAPASAPAEIVYTPVNQSIVSGGISFDLNQDGVADFTVHDESAFAYEPAWVRIRGYGAYAAVAGNGRAAALASGVAVGSSARFTSVANRDHGLGLARISCGYGTDSKAFAGCWVSGPWELNGQERFLGLKIVINGETHFGWARMFIRLMFPPSFKWVMRLNVVDYAYESTPNKAIVTGDIGGAAIRQENFDDRFKDDMPSTSLGHLALGALHTNSSKLPRPSLHP